MGQQNHQHLASHFDTHTELSQGQDLNNREDFTDKATHCFYFNVAKAMGIQPRISQQRRDENGVVVADSG